MSLHGPGWSLLTVVSARARGVFNVGDRDHVDFFRYLMHARPNVLVLTLRMLALGVGQANTKFQSIYYTVYSTGGNICAIRSQKQKWCKYEERLQGAGRIHSGH